MPFFPNQIMPKSLHKEEASEVDDSPLVYNARDYNIHHREIIAIEKVIIGQDPSVPDNDVEGGEEGNGGGGNDGGNDGVNNVDGGNFNNIQDAIDKIVELIDLALNRGYIGQYSGTVQSGGTVPIPISIPNTKTANDISSSSNSITVVSTQGFPNTGVITKFNSLSPKDSCSDGNFPDGGRCNSGEDRTISYNGLLGSGYHATNQEIITYTSKTDTSFEGCTRGVNASTAQNTTESSPALVLCGRAAISFTHNFWGRGEDGIPNEFYLYHDASLLVKANLLGIGNRTRSGDVLQDLIEIGWILTVSGYFANFNINTVQA